MDPEQFAAILTACLERGFVPPLYVCAVSVNGATITARFAYTPEEEGMDVTVLTEYCPEHVYALPVNMMVTDTQGEAARVILHFEGWGFADRN